MSSSEMLSVGLASSAFANVNLGVVVVLRVHLFRGVLSVGMVIVVLWNFLFWGELALVALFN